MGDVRFSRRLLLVGLSRRVPLARCDSRSAAADAEMQPRFECWASTSCTSVADHSCHATSVQVSHAYTSAMSKESERARAEANLRPLRCQSARLRGRPTRPPLSSPGRVCPTFDQLLPPSALTLSEPSRHGLLFTTAATRGRPGRCFDGPRGADGTSGHVWCVGPSIGFSARPPLSVARADHLAPDRMAHLKAGSGRKREREGSMEPSDKMSALKLAALGLKKVKEDAEVRLLSVEHRRPC